MPKITAPFVAFPSENFSEPPRWSCECCGIGFWWWRRKEGKRENLAGKGIFAKWILLPGPAYGDLAPLSVKLGGKEYGVCSLDCFKTVFLVKSLEAVAAALDNLAQKR